MRKKNCDCELCKRNRKFEGFLKKYPFTKNDTEFLNKIYLDLNMTEFELNHREAILDGSWPQAVEILERSLEEAKKFRAEQENKNVERV
jgi:hypothetical protein